MTSFHVSTQRSLSFSRCLDAAMDTFVRVSFTFRPQTTLLGGRFFCPGCPGGVLESAIDELLVDVLLLDFDDLLLLLLLADEDEDEVELSSPSTESLAVVKPAAPSLAPSLASSESLAVVKPVPLLA